MINVLYGILTNGSVASGIYSWYGKTCDNPLHTTKIDAIRDIVLSGIPATKLNFFACVICGLLQNTVFDEEIKKLDPNNTYATPSRPPTAEHSDSDYCFYSLVQSVEAYRALRNYLDDDIFDKVSGGTWLDWVAAGCLQMLREVYR